MIWSFSFFGIIFRKGTLHFVAEFFLYQYICCCFPYFDMVNLIGVNLKLVDESTERELRKTCIFMEWGLLGTWVPESNFY